MISSDNRRYAYGKSQLIEVICQLRFPTILSIDTREPADFQETVRAAFPRYQCQVEKLPGVNGAPARTVNNHTFISEDGGYKLSLTKDFIALSTMRYTHWEDFAARLDEPLGQFIKIYRSTSSASSTRLRRSSCTQAPALCSATSETAIACSRCRKRKCASSSIRMCTPPAK